METTQVRCAHAAHQDQFLISLNHHVMQILPQLNNAHVKQASTRLAMAINFFAIVGTPRQTE
jgi:hypothetical protein